MTPILTRLLEQLLLPPGVMVTGILITLLLLHFPRSAPPATRSGRVRRALVLLGALTWLSLLPVTANLLADHLHPPTDETVLTPERLRQSQAQAIVVFGYGRAPKAPEYDGQDTLLPGGLTRIRYAAHLYRLTGLPLLVAGGRPYGETRSEADIMRGVLEEEFFVPVAWMDEESRNTFENAANSAALLKQANIRRILLVVHNRDLPRALLAFQQAAGESIQVTPAPILFRNRHALRFSWDPVDLWPWIPNADALALLAVELHEWLGQLWYRLR
ncbi:MAG: YdcF family protein [Magnetococcales bacterium]|nr:YdcF family protein [Magnetococcales bacterium]